MRSDYVDSHVHLWDPTRLRYPWLDGLGDLERPHILADYREATADDPPSAFVFVQAGAADSDADAETRWVDAMCSDAPDYVGAVAWAPVRDGARETIDHLDSIAGCALVGVRELIQGMPAGYCTARDFVAGVAAVGSRDLTFDICVTGDELGDAVELARAVPRTRLVLDHCGKPDIAARDLDRWRALIGDLADLDNVTCKLSGLVTEADIEHDLVGQLRPVIHDVLEAFGPHRVMWGSDWPVLTGATSHAEWRQLTDEILADLAAEERQAVLSATARRTYRLHP